MTIALSLLLFAAVMTCLVMWLVMAAWRDLAREQKKTILLLEDAVKVLRQASDKWKEACEAWQEVYRKHVSQISRKNPWDN